MQKGTCSRVHRKELTLQNSQLVVTLNEEIFCPFPLCVALRGTSIVINYTKA